MAKSLRRIIEELTAKYSPVIRNAFLAAIADISNEVILKDLIKAIEANDVNQAFRVLGMSDAAMRPLTAALAETFEAGGIGAGSTFPRVLHTPFGNTRFLFDVRATRAENWLREQSSRLIVEIQEDTRVAVRNTLTRGLEAGNNPRVTALDIVGRIGASGKREGGLIGLTSQQESWVNNARADLETLDARYLTRIRRDKRFDKIVERAIKDGKPLTKETIDKLISRYKDSLLQLRGETIGRTESIQSLNRSNFEAIRQAKDIGALRGATKEWDSAGDARVRESHRAMDGQVTELEEPFITPDGYSLMFPGDTSLGAPAKEIIQCRCRFKLRMDWLADID